TRPRTARCARRLATPPTRCGALLLVRVAVAGVRNHGHSGVAVLHGAGAQTRWSIGYRSTHPHQAQVGCRNPRRGRAGNGRDRRLHRRGGSPLTNNQLRGRTATAGHGSADTQASSITRAIEEFPGNSISVPWGPSPPSPDVLAAVSAWPSLTAMACRTA